MGTNIARLKEFYDWLPDEFWQSMESGGLDRFVLPLDWHSDEMLMYNDDTDTWSTMWYDQEYVTEDGKFYIEVHDNYECGDRELYKRHLVEDDPEQVESEISNEFWMKRRRQNLRYLNWVVENGEDPVGFFFLSEMKKVKKKFQMRFVPNHLRVEWAGWRKPSDIVWRNPETAPFYLHDYLDAERSIGTFLIGGDEFYWENVNGVGDVRYLRTSGPNEIIFEVELEEEVPNRHYKRKLLLRARKEIFRMQKEEKDG